jgi:hypothetical protein
MGRCDSTLSSSQPDSTNREGKPEKKLRGRRVSQQQLHSKGLSHTSLASHSSKQTGGHSRSDLQTEEGQGGALEDEGKEGDGEREMRRSTRMRDRSGEKSCLSKRRSSSLTRRVEFCGCLPSSGRPARVRASKGKFGERRLIIHMMSH